MSGETVKWLESQLRTRRNSAKRHEDASKFHLNIGDTKIAEKALNEALIDENIANDIESILGLFKRNREN